MEVLDDYANMLNNSQIDITNLIPEIKEKLLNFTKKLENEKSSNEISDRPSIKEYKNLSSDYISEYSTKAEYIQYARSYFSRLMEVKKTLLDQAKENWRGFKVCDNILDMKGKVKIIFYKF